MTEHEAARRPQMSDGGLFNDPIIWWANHLRTTKGRDTFYDGFLIPMNQEKRENGPELDEFLKELGQDKVEIKHTDATRTYWAMPTLDAFVIANGVQSWAEIKIDTNPNESAFVRYGIAACWNDFQRMSMLRFRCLPTAWLAAGWTHPITFTAQGLACQDVIRALTRHFDLLDLIDNSLKAQGKEPLNPPYYEVAVELVAGAEIKRGKPGAQSEVTPVVTGVPDNVTIDYVRKHYIKKDWKEIVGSHIKQTVVWSSHESKRMSLFKNDNNAQQPATNGAARNGTAPVAATRNVPQPMDDVHPGEDLPF